MSELRNPHDLFFRETFSRLEIAKDFLQTYLPVQVVKNLNLNSLELQKDSFVDEELREHFSDSGNELTAEDMQAALNEAFKNDGGSIMSGFVEKWIEQGIEQGITQGVEKGLTQSILRVLVRRFDQVPAGIEARLQRLTAQKLELVLDEALTATDLADFDRRLEAVEA